MQSTKKKYIEDLNEHLNELEKILNFPDLCIYEHFSDLINEVDSIEYFTVEAKILASEFLESLRTRVNEDLNENSYQEMKSIISGEIIRLLYFLFRMCEKKQ